MLFNNYQIEIKRKLSILLIGSINIGFDEINIAWLVLEEDHRGDSSPPLTDLLIFVFKVSGPTA